MVRIEQYLKEKLNEANAIDESYIMIVKPYFRRAILNPVLIKEGDKLFVTNQNKTHFFNVFNYDEITVGVTDREFYSKYDHNGNIIK